MLWFCTLITNISEVQSVSELVFQSLFIDKEIIIKDVQKSVTVLWGMLILE